jgi:hypothetical protein
MPDKINHPEHYGTGTYEAINVIDAWGVSFNLGNALKYICRAGKKSKRSRLDDLKKAAWYLNHEIETLEGVKFDSVVGNDEAP